MLTDRDIKIALPRKKKYKLMDNDGLYLLIMPNGSKLWRFRYQLNKKSYEIALGKYPLIPLRDARQKALGFHTQIANGVNPAEQVKINTNKITEQSDFRSVAEKWLVQKQQKYTERHLETIQSRLINHIYPALAKKSMPDIKTADILDLVESITSIGHIETARRCLGIISEVFRYGVLSGKCDYDVTSPLKGYVSKQKPKHMPTITDPAQIAELLKALWAYHGSARVRYAARLSVYTFVRPGEIRHAEWQEINFEDKIWSISAQKMKMRRAHIVPLSNQAMSILTELYEITGDRKYIFSNPRRDKDIAMSENTVNQVLKGLGYENIIVPHGFRGMASTLLHEQGYNPLHIESQLAHAQANEIKAAYNHAEYLPQRTQMMQDWADYLDKLRKS